MVLAGGREGGGIEGGREGDGEREGGVWKREGGRERGRDFFWYVIYNFLSLF